MTGFGHNCHTSKVKNLWSTCSGRLTTTGTAMDLVWLFFLSGQRCREAICYWFVLRSSLLYLLFLACFGMLINVFNFLFVDKTKELNHIKASLPVVWVRFNCHRHHSLSSLRTKVSLRLTQHRGNYCCCQVSIKFIQLDTTRWMCHTVDAGCYKTTVMAVILNCFGTTISKIHFGILYEILISTANFSITLYISCCFHIEFKCLIFNWLSEALFFALGDQKHITLMSFILSVHCIVKM